MKRTALTLACIGFGLSITALPSVAGSDSEASHSDKEMIQISQETRQSMIEGKVEGALLINEELNNFDIDVAVNQDEVILSGEVESPSERDLAEETALSIDGVNSVDNQLKIATRDEESEQEASSVIKDATITAMVKTSLLTNSNVSGTDIKVETKKQVVTLKGEVESDVESDLAEKIAENTEDVKSVENRLQVVAR